MQQLAEAAHGEHHRLRRLDALMCATLYSACLYMMRKFEFKFAFVAEAAHGEVYRLRRLRVCVCVSPVCMMQR